MRCAWRRTNFAAGGGCRGGGCRPWGGRGGGRRGGRVAHVAEGFAAHGGREVVSIAGGQRSEDQADVGASSDVIGDDEEWSECVAKIFAAEDFWVAEDFGGWPHEAVIDGEAEKADRFALRPARVDVGDAAGGLRGRVCGAGGLIRGRVEI